MQGAAECLDYLARPALESQGMRRGVTYGTNEKGAAEAAPLDGRIGEIRPG